MKPLLKQEDGTLSITEDSPTEIKVSGTDAQLAEQNATFAEVLDLINQLKQKNPQFNIDGERNIWIMKPAGSSRGRGICLQKSLSAIMDVCRLNRGKYVVQKYIENSMIIHKRKFDIRQWVLVTDWNPLTVWMYTEPYIRFAAADFSYSKI